MATSPRRLRRIATPSAAVIALALLAGCAATNPTDPSSGAGAGTPTTTQTQTQAGAAADPADACALISPEEVTAFLGADPGPGVAEAGNIEGGQCTWTINDTSALLLQYSTQADKYFPDGVFPTPADGAAIPGADRGFAAASTSTILLVKNGKGVMVTNIAFGSTNPDQSAYETLAAAIAQRL